MKVYVSILASDPMCYGKDIKAAEAAGVDGLHMDVLDGHFAPDIIFGPKTCAAFKKSTGLPMGAHLMVTNTDEILPEYLKTPFNTVTIHVEHTKDMAYCIGLIHMAQIKAAIAIDSYTNVSAVEKYIPDIDGALVMSVKAGAGGQSFKEEALDKINRIRRIADNYNPDFNIIVDGGVKASNVRMIQDAGASSVVMGTALTGAEDMSLALKEIRAKLS